MGGKRARSHSLAAVPVELPPSVRLHLGAESDRLVDALKEPPPVSIRHNPLKPAAKAGEPVPWCAQGRYLAQRPVFTLDPLFHQGAYYVQEAASMLVERAYRACAELPMDPVVLDLCAAPGGKSTHLASLLPSGGLLICNEPVHARQSVLAENIWKWGRPGIILTGNPPAAFHAMGPFCDLVLVDAPCSGEGMFRKDPFARVQWSEGLVESCAAKQQGIVDEAWAVLKPGGYLIYSTCTWESRENEEQVQRLFRRGAQLIPVPVEAQWGVLATEAGLRCYPHRVQGEGFFLALVQKPMASNEPVPGLPPAHGHVDQSSTYPEVLNWLEPSGSRALIEKEGELHALSKERLKLASALSGCGKVLALGTPVAQRKGAGWTPHPALALNAILRSDAFPALDLDADHALRYLRGEALPAKDAKGVVLMRHQGQGLGWANGAGTRWNNNWPVPWRIRMR